VDDQPLDYRTSNPVHACEIYSRPNAAILVVTAANTDLVNSDGPKMAREVDPEGKSRLCVHIRIPGDL
jgi:vacuolar protein sorting-associated protein 1